MYNLLFIFLCIFSVNNSLVSCDENGKVKKYQSEESGLLKSMFSLGDGNSKKAMKKSPSLPTVSENFIDKYTTKEHGLLTASRINNMNCMKLYIKNKFLDLNMQDTLGNTIVHWAAANKNLEMLEILLKDPRPDGTIRNHSGQTSQDIIRSFAQSTTDENERKELFRYSKMLFARYILNETVKKFAKKIKLVYLQAGFCDNQTENPITLTAEAIIRKAKSNDEKQAEINRDTPIPGEAQYPTYATLEFVIDMLNWQLAQPSQNN